VGGKVTTRYWPAIALCVLTSLGTGSSLAQAPDEPRTEAVEQDRAAEARAHFTRGNELYATGDLRGTLAEFERAYALRPSPLLSFHIGRVALELRQFADSYRAITRFLAELADGDPDSAEKRAQAQAMLAEIGPRIAHLTIECNVVGARLSINEQPLVESPLPEALVLDVGTYRVRASKQDFAPVTRVISLAGGDRSTLTLELEALDAPPPLMLAPVSPPIERPSLSAVPPAQSTLQQHVMTQGLWAGFALGGALAVAGGITGIYALKASSRLDSTRYYDTNRAGFERESERVRALSISADVLLGAAFVTLQTSAIYFWWRAHHPGKAHVGAGLVPRGLTVRGAF